MPQKSPQTSKKNQLVSSDEESSDDYVNFIVFERRLHQKMKARVPQKTPQTSKKSQVLSSDEESSDDYDFNQQAKKKPRPADKKTVRVFDAIFACRDWCFIAEQPVPAPHLAHPEGCAALRIVLVTVPRVSRSCEHSPDGFDLPLLQEEHVKRAPPQEKREVKGPGLRVQE